MRYNILHEGDYSVFYMLNITWGPLLRELSH